MEYIYVIIRQLGATSKYKGYFYTAEAVELAMKSQERPFRITKDVYPRLATKYKVSAMSVEHDIRTLINVCWESNKSRLDEIAGYNMTYRPTNSEFIDMLAYYVSKISG